MKIVFFGSDEFSARHLECLLDSGYDVRLVVTQPDRPRGRGKRLLPTPVKELAIRRDVEVVHPKRLKDIAERIREFDVGILVSFGRIVPREVFEAPKFGIFNVHPSLLPKYRGAAPMNRVLENGEKLTGVTIMKLVEELDAGPVALQRSFEIGEYTTYGELFETSVKVGCELLTEFLELLWRGEISLRDQEGEASYAPKIAKDDLKIDFSKPAVKVKDKIRAYDPTPGAFAFLKGERVKLFEVKDVRNEDEGRAGEILEVSRDGAWVKCGEGAVLVGKIQFPGKKPVGFFDAMNGRRLEVGDIFS